MTSAATTRRMPCISPAIGALDILRFQPMEEFHRIRRLAALCFRAGQPAEGQRPHAWRRHYRSRHGQSRSADAARIVDKLCETCGKPRTDRYSSSRGIPGLRRAQAAYYARRFGVKLNPETQVVATLGSKEGFANMAQAITAPGDVDPVPEPDLSDPCLRLLMAGGVIRSLPSEPDAGFLPGARACDPAIRSRSRWR